MHTGTARGTILAMEPFGIRYVRPVRPVEFPSTDPEWDMSEGTRHARLCEIIYKLLRTAAGPEACVGADQFVYFDPVNPKRKCAPDAFLKLERAQCEFPSWKTWEMGVPNLCVEILSPSDTEEKLTLEQKLQRFCDMGVAEVLFYNVDEAPGARLRAWDRVRGDWLERIVEGDATPCRTLGLWFVIAPCAEENQDLALRLAQDKDGRELVPTLAERQALELAQVQESREQERLAKEQERLEKEQERLAKEQAMAAEQAALARVAELEARLVGRG
jgi:Uma2 family endonuclease